jgi:hypothetical protein
LALGVAGRPGWRRSPVPRGRRRAAGSPRGESHPRTRVGGATLAVFSAATLLETVVEDVVHPMGGWTSATSDLFVWGTEVVGVTALSAVLQQIMGSGTHELHGRTTTELVGHLPYGRLVVALAAMVGTLLLVLPDIWVFTQLASVGPVIKLELRRVMSALRRSYQLVRHHFWLTAVPVTLPVLVGEEITGQVTHLSAGWPSPGASPRSATPCRPMCSAHPRSRCESARG